MQFHGTADLWSGASAVVGRDALQLCRVTAGKPAVTLRSVGSAGGQAAAFTYDLAQLGGLHASGQPGVGGPEARRAAGPIRSDDLFFPDYLDFSKVHIPQADEQQRLLANLITQMNFDRTPLPRFWYLPRGEKAAFVMSGDDHGSAAGTGGHFDRFKALSPAGCSVADWECIRGTSYVFPAPGCRSSAANAYQAQGFEIALHLNTGCSDFTPDVAERQLGPASCRSSGAVPGRDSAAHQPHALHRLERLGQRAEARAGERRAARHELLLLARRVGAGPSRHVHGLGLPAALRRRSTAR